MSDPRATPAAATGPGVGADSEHGHDQGDASPRPSFRWGGCTHVGGVRQVNEDSWFASHDVCVVADGMGGHAAGEVASGLVVALVSDAFATERLRLVDLPNFVSSLNSAVLRRGAENGTRGMGTTLVGAAVIDNGATPSVVVFHVGDSRCYRLRQGVLTQVTSDHSHVQELVQAGRITEREAVGHPLRNIITRALGAEVTVHADFHVLDEEDCRLLLCSDGLSGEIDDDLIWDVLTHERDPDAAARRLVDITLDGPARDNVTVVVVDVEFPVDEFDPGRTRLHPAGAALDVTGDAITAEKADPDATAEPNAEVTAEPAPPPPGGTNAAWAPPAPRARGPVPEWHPATASDEQRWDRPDPDTAARSRSETPPPHPQENADDRIDP